MGTLLYYYYYISKKELGVCKELQLLMEAWLCPMQVGRLLFAALTSPCRHVREAPKEFFARVTGRLSEMYVSTAGERAAARPGGLLNGGGPLNGGTPGGAQDPIDLLRRLKDSKGIAVHAIAAAKVTTLLAQHFT